MICVHDERKGASEEQKRRELEGALSFLHLLSSFFLSDTAPIECLSPLFSL